MNIGHGPQSMGLRKSSDESGMIKAVVPELEHSVLPVDNDGTQRIRAPEGGTNAADQQTEQVRNVTRSVRSDVLSPTPNKEGGHSDGNEYKKAAGDTPRKRKRQNKKGRVE